jgi:hypothetical protein
MKKLLPFLLLISLTVPNTASAAGSLEFEFGENGKAITPVALGSQWTKSPVHMAEAPDGGIVLAGAATVVRHLPTGALDPAFGRGGILTIDLADVTGFEITDVAVDSTGRIVIFGTAARIAPAGGVTTEPAVLRYLADGEPDRSFGDGDGVVMARFGLASAGNALLGAVDAENRVLLVTGSHRLTAGCGKAGRQVGDWSASMSTVPSTKVSANVACGASRLCRG